MNTLKYKVGCVFPKVLNMKEVLTWSDTHAVSLLIHANFSSKLMITRRNSGFGPLSTCSKFRFWSSSNKWRWIKNDISNINQSRDHEVFEISPLVYLHLFELDQKRNFVSWNGIHMLHMTTSLTFKTGLKVEPPRSGDSMTSTFNVPPPASGDYHWGPFDNDRVSLIKDGTYTHILSYSSCPLASGCTYKCQNHWISPTHRLQYSESDRKDCIGGIPH